jgi:hypothetical protein
VAIFEDAGIPLLIIAGGVSLLGAIRHPPTASLRPPVVAGDCDHALHIDHPNAPSILAPYLEPGQEIALGGEIPDSGSLD